MRKETGGPAFPGYGEIFIEGPQGHGPQSAWGMQGSQGMSLRDYFAAKAMQSFLINQPPHATDMTYAEWASDSYQMADAMLEARK